MGLNYLVVSTLNFALLKKKTNIKFKFANKFFKLLLVIIPTSALCAFTVNLGQYVFPLIVNLMLSGIICVVSFVLLAASVNVFDIKAFLIGAKKRFFPEKLKLKKAKKKV